MSRIITTCKFVGTISLGLLTGLSYTLSTTTLPPLLALPSATPAASTFRHLRLLTTRNQLLLSALSASAFLVAYTVSPRHGRHPYLLYSGFAVALGWSGELLAKLRAGVEAKKEEGKGKGKERMREESWSEDEEWIEREGVNGEAVREGIERWRARQGWKAAVWGVGWGLAVLGIWGDGV